MESGGREASLADVAVPVPLPHALTYLIPERLEIAISGTLDELVQRLHAIPVSRRTRRRAERDITVGLSAGLGRLAPTSVSAPPP